MRWAYLDTLCHHQKTGKVGYPTRTKSQRWIYCFSPQLSTETNIIAKKKHRILDLGTLPHSSRHTAGKMDPLYKKNPPPPIIRPPVIEGLFRFVLVSCSCCSSTCEELDLCLLRLVKVYLVLRVYTYTGCIFRQNHALLQGLHWFMAMVHWPPLNKFACKLHGYIVYLYIALRL